jgi:hypothetical protein
MPPASCKENLTKKAPTNGTTKKNLLVQRNKKYISREEDTTKRKSMEVSSIRKPPILILEASLCQR